MNRASISARRAAGLASAALAGLAACNTATSTPPSALTLDRPTDASFACFGTVRITGGGRAGTTSDPIVSQGAPVGDCDQFSKSFGKQPVPVFPDPNAPPLGQEDLSTPTAPSAPSVNYYSFFLEPTAGTLAVATWTPMPAAQMANGNVRVLDLDPLTPGAAGISVGDFPIGVATDKNGCYEVTANAGTCDLTTVSVGSVLSTPPNPVIDRLDITNAGGAKILARPAAVAAEPQSGAIGAMCPSTPQGLLYIAYPDCHRIAAIDTSTGTAVASLLFTDDADPTKGVDVAVTDGNFTCPAQCGAGDPITDGPRPTSLDLVVDPRMDGSKPAQTQRLAIGIENRSTVTVVDLDGSNMPTTTSKKVILQGSVGVTDVALTPQIGMGGAGGAVSDDSNQAGNGPGGQFQFVYAVATDGTVRVVDFLNVNDECDTNIDPRFLTTGSGNAFIHYLSCMTDKDPLTPHLPAPNATIVARRPGARGPGIQLVGDARPISVAVVHALPDTTSAMAMGQSLEPAPDLWIGYFAAITATTGAVYIANIDDDNYVDVNDPTKPISVWMNLAMPHQLRDRIANRSALAESSDATASPVCDVSGQDPNQNQVTDLADGPRMWPTDSLAGHPIEQLAPATAIAQVKTFQLPSIAQELCVGSDKTMPVSTLAFAAQPSTRAKAFPDLRGLTNDEVWSIAWEGDLSIDSANNFVDGPAVRTGQVVVDGTGMRVQESDHPYCAMGVEPYDQVVLDGCDPTGTNPCGLGETCYVHPASRTGVGSCMPTKLVDALSDACKEFLVSNRKYAVTDAKAGQLALMPRSHVLTTTPLDGCTSADQCSTLEDVKYRLVHAQHPIADKGPLDPQTEPIHTWACEADPSRPGPNQCVMSCQAQTPDGQHGDLDCEAGSVCDPLTLRCVDGVVPPLQCVTALQHYEVDAGRAFTVAGTRSGYVHPIVEDTASGECVVDPKANPLLTGRIPLTGLPPCMADGFTDLSPNPCSTTVTQSEYQPKYSDITTCTLDPSSPVIGSRTAQAIRFRNAAMTFEMVDPTYSGDATCLGDRGGTLNAPLVFPGYALELRIVSGFLPYLVQLSQSGLTGTVMPMRARKGPLESLWVIDGGDFLSQSVASTRGTVWRVESVAPLIINTIQ
jgi:hypothetical protein